MLRDLRLAARAWLRDEAQAALDAYGAEDAEKAIFGKAREALAGFFDRARAFVRESVLAGALALGGPAPPTPPVMHALDRQVAGQHAYLEKFRTEVLDGSTPVDPTFVARAELYGGPVWSAPMNAAREASVGAGVATHESRHHRGHDEPCEVCVAEQARGVVPIGTLRPIGDSPCMCHCHCVFVYHDADGNEVDVLGAAAAGPEPAPALPPVSEPGPAPGPEPAPKAPKVPKFRTWEEARDWAAANLKTPVKLWGGDVPLIREAVSAVHEIERRTGGAIPNTTVIFSRPPGDPRAYGQCTADKETGASKLYVRPQFWDQTSRENDDKVWREERKTDVPFHSTTSVRGIVWHEAAHAFDANVKDPNGDIGGLSFGLRYSPDEATGRRKLDAVRKVSGYAESDWYGMNAGREAFAECFAAVATGSPRAKHVPDFALEQVRKVLPK